MKPLRKQKIMSNPGSDLIPTIHLNNWELQMLKDILPIAPDLDGNEETLERYESLRDKIVCTKQSKSGK